MSTYTYNYVQTFYVNPDTVAGAAEVMLTSIDLFVKNKTFSASRAKPSLNVWICPVENDEPDPNISLANSIKNIPWDLVNESYDAQIATTVGFNNPVLLKTGKYYGIVIKSDDGVYDLWVNTQGQYIVAPGGVTNQISPGSQSRFDGFLYTAMTFNNSTSPVTDTLNTKHSNKDLKFRVKVAQYLSNTISIPVVNKDYEFFTIDNTRVGAFIGGEWVYQDIDNATGTITVSSSSNTITGVATNLSSYAVENKIVISNGTVRDVLTITNVVSNTEVIVDRFPSFSASSIGFKVPPIGALYYTDYPKNKVYLVDSNASNSTFKFVTGTRIVGARSGATANVASIDRFKADKFKPTFLVGNPTTSDYSISYNIANSSNAMPATTTNLELFKFNDAVRESYILSRSLEVDNINLYGTERKSAVANITFNVQVSETNSFSAPYINTGELDLFFYQNDINNTYTETRGGITDYDTEVDRNGLAKTKYLTKKISFGEGKYAEDVVIYLAGYRPAGTQIKVYAKLHNSADKESFDDKAWTPLEIKNNIDRYSTEDPNDLWEYTYGLPPYPEVYSNLSGSFLTTLSSNSISTDVDQSSVLATGDLIRVYDPLTPDNHEVFPVASANTTAITLFKQISNNNIVGDMSIQKLKYKNVAWNNIANDNVARYVTSSYTEFDTYNTMQIKIVLLSETTYVVPRVEQVQVIGVSA